jgi:hypothetical protein
MLSPASQAYEKVTTEKEITKSKKTVTTNFVDP